MDEISVKLYARLLKVNHEAAVNILLSALGSMQGYNGQTIQECLHEAIGSEQTDNGWVVPSVAQLNERFTN